MVKTHDREYFHKYVKGEDAVRILETLRVKWTSSRLFNDPFDVQVGIRFPFEPGLLLARTAAEIEKVLFAEDEPVGDASSHILTAVKELRPQRSTLPRDNFKPWVEANFGDLFRDTQTRLLRQANERWEEFWRDKKLFCVAEAHDNLLMWAHYADSHRGAVLKLRCLPDRDTALCAAMPVIYQDILPSLGDVETWARCVVGTGPTPLGSDVFKNYWLTKSTDWEHEREWRTITKAEREDGPGFALLEIHPEEIDAIHLGCRMPDGARAEIARRLTGPLEHVHLFHAGRSETHFALEFTLIREGRHR